MVMGPDVTRTLRPGEEAEVDALLRAAFPGPEEAELALSLRRDGLMFQEHVIPWGGRIGAYSAISRMVAPEGWYCLAPVAVWPDWQNGALGRREGATQGFVNTFRFGSRLVHGLADTFLDPDGLWALQRARKGEVLAEPPTLVVLGKPSFYGRAGFSQARAARLTTRYPLENTLIARPGTDVPQATLIYPAAFDGV